MPSNPAPIPMIAIIGDALGTIVAAIGALAHFDVLHILPEHWRFENYTIVMMVVGLLMTLPFIRHVIRRFTT